MTTALQIFDALDAATEAALRASIERHGVLVPVAVDQDGRVIDGHHRSRIAAELGVKHPTIEHFVRDDQHARELARTLNEDRRQLAPEQRREVVADLRAQGHSLRAIGGAVGVDDKTVRNDLNATADKSAVPDRIVGLDGKSRPATRTKPETIAEAPANPPAAEESKAEAPKPARKRIDPDAEPPYDHLDAVTVAVRSALKAGATSQEIHDAYQLGLSS